jgi:hypothetical protein
MQRQLRLGDILDDYCPRERRLTNHAVVAMIGADVKQTRCTTCDAEHEYKHAKLPRQRRKTETPAALYSQVLTSGPKRHEHPSAVEPPSSNGSGNTVEEPAEADRPESEPAAAGAERPEEAPHEEDGDQEERRDDDGDESRDEGPVHRPLIRASLPRPEGQPPSQRPVPEFTIRQPGARPNRFRPRHGRGPQLHGNRPSGQMSGAPRGGMQRPGGGRPPMTRLQKRHGRNKRSK